jgi:hypothetical protein
MRSNFIYKNPLTEYHAASVLAFKSALASWLRASRGRRSGVPHESLVIHLSKLPSSRARLSIIAGASSADVPVERRLR